MPNVLNRASNTIYREIVGSASPKGQITLPLDVRQDVGIKDTVLIRVDEEEIKVCPTSVTVLDSFQAIPALKKPLSFAEIREITQKLFTIPTRQYRTVLETVIGE